MEDLYITYTVLDSSQTVVQNTEVFNTVQSARGNNFCAHLLTEIQDRNYVLLEHSP